MGLQMDNKTKGILEYRFPLPPFISELGRQGVPLSCDKINERATLLFPKISHNCEMWGKGGRGELGETTFLSIYCSYVQQAAFLAGSGQISWKSLFAAIPN